MFSSLAKYKEQSYYDEHPVLYFLTPDGDYKIELYAEIVVGRDALIYVPHPDEKEFAEFLSNAKEKSTFSSEVEITENDTLITLTFPIWNLSAMRSVKPLKSMAAWIFW